MRIIEPSVSFVGGNLSAADRAKHVELCGRVCYKSEDRITHDSADRFIKGVIKREHEAVLEHARITLRIANEISYGQFAFIRSDMRKHGLPSFLSETYCWGSRVISGNMRAWRNFATYATNNMLLMPEELHKMFCDNAVFFPEFIRDSDVYNIEPGLDIAPHRLPAKDRVIHSWYTLRFICDRGVSHEIVRHRPASYCQESTRYCNYAKGDFSGQITVVKPCFLTDGTDAYRKWVTACEGAEKAYFDLLSADYSPQEARDVLPTSLKTELVMTATAEEWLHFIKLRTASDAHPQMREVATRAREILLEQDAEVFGGGWL